MFNKGLKKFTKVWLAVCVKFLKYKIDGVISCLKDHWLASTDNSGEEKELNNHNVFPPAACIIYAWRNWQNWSRRYQKKSTKAILKILFNYLIVIELTTV